MKETLTLVRKIEMETGRELHRHLEIGDTREDVRKRPSETFNGISGYWNAELISRSQRRSKWFTEFDLDDVNEYGCIYRS